jgi:ABC-2 type transport system permease protein
MNAMTLDPSAVGQATLGRTRLLGLGNLVRKDLAEWFHGKRPWLVLGITSSVFALTAANARITEWAAASFPADPGDGPAKVMSQLPLDNLLIALGTQFLVLAVIFATMSLLIAERDSGTLAWTISKPVSRTSVLVSKWLTSTLILWVAAVVIPLGLTTAVVTVLYGAPDLAAVAALGVLLIAVPAFFVAVSLAAATFVPSQAAVGAIGLAVLAVPPIVGGIIPAVAPFFPTSIFDWAVAVSMGGQASIATPIAWLVGMVALLVIARRRLNGMDL